MREIGVDTEKVSAPDEGVVSIQQKKQALLSRVANRRFLETLARLQDELDELRARKETLIERAQEKQIIELARSLPLGEYGDLEIRLSSSLEVGIAFKGNLVFFAEKPVDSDEYQIGVYRSATEWEDLLAETAERHRRNEQLQQILDEMQTIRDNFTIQEAA